MGLDLLPLYPDLLPLYPDLCPQVQGDAQLEPVELATDVQAESSEETDDAMKEPGPSPSLPFTHGFVASLSVIIVSEIGDKTFFIAAIMAMQHSRAMVCAGAIFSLGEWVAV